MDPALAEIITFAEAKGRLKKLKGAASGVFEYFEKSSVNVLYIEKDWAEFDFDELEIDEDIDLVIFKGRVDVDGTLFLTSDSLLELFPGPERFIFMSPVTCADLIVPADISAIFLGGLEVDRLACFASPDSTAVVQRNFSAQAALSGLGDAWLILDDAKSNIAYYSNYIEGYEKESISLELVIKKSLDLKWENPDELSLWEWVLEHLT